MTLSSAAAVLQVLRRLLRRQITVLKLSLSRNPTSSAASELSASSTSSFLCATAEASRSSSVCARSGPDSRQSTASTPFPTSGVTASPRSTPRSDTFSVILPTSSHSSFSRRLRSRALICSTIASLAILLWRATYVAALSPSPRAVQSTTPARCSLIPRVTATFFAAQVFLPLRARTSLHISVSSFPSTAAAAQ